ncbi:glycosyltransferase [Uruburuella testudinis]|uniref:Glycosyltransferase n=1 Tax=Uruburuella testudinis TaxID=1282863 RepID=A0ABY4DYJ3_9NEIS|nr:glycosyltransferase [Uruburuella testudinis]UOO81741.1 glycosyltransferase [Uruburuella testudinis]
MKKILSEAIAQYENQNYLAALDLFEQAAAIYGEKIVALHIQKCRAALKDADASFSAAPAVALVLANVPSSLDPATKILLNNQKSIQLSDGERNNLLQAWKQATHKKSESVEAKKVNPIPADWPKDLQLAPLPEGPNDYVWHQRRKNNLNHSQSLSAGLSVIVPTFNRSWILDITLACLVNQKTKFPFEVIVADDGSKEQIVDIVRKYEDSLDIKYVRQHDYGYQLCAVRNLGLRTAKYDYVSILDCDMAPNPVWVQSYLQRLLKNDDVALIGPRKYVDTHGLKAADFLADKDLVNNLPEIRSSNTVASTQTPIASVDWRLEHFAKTDNLRLCDSPFRYFSGGNVAFAKKWLDKAGWFDEAFTHWGGEDNEFGYRLFKKGCFFQALEGGMAYHQEPPGKENETDRAEGKKITINIVKEKVPYFYRKPIPLEHDVIHAVPLVSIYIPAYNCASSIVRCVDSALNQTITDLEVCICDDGSTDNTLAVIQQRYGNHPRVKIMTKANGGISTASNAAVKMANGFYIGQLDSDDYLEPDAVELCLTEFLKNRKLACVYTTNRNVNPDGSLIANGYNWPEFSREKLTTAMIVHHFRMFSARAWHLTDGFNENIANAVDYDIYLKLSEVGEFQHINKICYNRVLHGENTSIKKLGLQKENHFKVVNASLARQNKVDYQYTPQDLEDNASRKYLFKLSNQQKGNI